MTDTLENGYSSESTQRELSNEYQHDRVYLFIKDRCVLVLWTKVTSAFEGLKQLEKVVLNLSHRSQKQHDTLILGHINDISWTILKVCKSTLRSIFGERNLMLLTHRTEYKQTTVGLNLLPNQSEVPSKETLASN